MNIITVGRMCVKLAGRDAGRKCVIVDESSYPLVLVDGNVRRKKVNVKHLEPLATMLEITSGAPHEEVKKAFEKSGLEVWDTTPKEAKPRPRQQRGKNKKVLESKNENNGKKGKIENKTAKKENKTAKEEVKEAVKSVSGEQA